MYVGAFQYLANKQRKHDHRQNLGNAKSIELKKLMDLAKNLLCEIETAINNTEHLKMPRVYTREKMDETLAFRSRDRNLDAVDDLDIKFAKVRFHEYLHNLDRIMKRPKKHVPCKNRKGKRRYLCGGKRNVTAVEPMGETTNNEIAHKQMQRRLNQRIRNGSGGARLNHIVDENGNRLQHPHRRHRQHGARRHQNPLNYQLVDESSFSGWSVYMRRNARKKMHRAFDVTVPTTTSTPVSTQ